MKIKQIKKLEAVRVHAPDAHKRGLGFEFLKPARSGRDVVVVENLFVRAGDKQLLDGASFAIERGEHVALVGPNGSGKTTLLETLLGRRGAADGVVRLGHGVEPAYFSQHEAELDERGSVLEAAMIGTGLKRPEAQSLLGKFLFSGWDEHEKRVAVLSGGERRRLALAIAVASGANFLVLDEPTNHLDLESREALEAALEAFPGTVLLVSHDRALLDAVASRLLAVESKTIASYPGGWADYVSAQDAEPVAPAPAPPKPKAEKPKRPAKPKTSQIELVEVEVARAESRLAELEQKLASDWGDADLVAEHRAAREDLEALLSRWEALFESTTP
jgi:ATP-binding cassette subfamily F protein 3